MRLIQRQIVRKKGLPIDWEGNTMEELGSEMSSDWRLYPSIGQSEGGLVGKNGLPNDWEGNRYGRIRE